MKGISPIVPRSKIETRPCIVCGARFKVNARGRKRLYCSAKCSRVAYYKGEREGRNRVSQRQD